MAPNRDANFPVIRFNFLMIVPYPTKLTQSHLIDHLVRYGMVLVSYYMTNPVPHGVILPISELGG